MGLVFRGDWEGAVAEFEVFGLGEVGDEGFTDCLCLRLRDILIEVDHTMCNTTLLVGTEIEAVAFDNLFAIRIDDVDDELIPVLLSYVSAKAILLS